MITERVLATNVCLRHLPPTAPHSLSAPKKAHNCSLMEYICHTIADFIFTSINYLLIDIFTYYTFTLERNTWRKPWFSITHSKVVIHYVDSNKIYTLDTQANFNGRAKNGSAPLNPTRPFMSFSNSFLSKLLGSICQRQFLFASHICFLRLGSPLHSYWSLFYALDDVPIWNRGMSYVVTFEQYIMWMCHCCEMPSVRASLWTSRALNRMEPDF